MLSRYQIFLDVPDVSDIALRRQMILVFPLQSHQDIQGG
jgi:hypothetical protein